MDKIEFIKRLVSFFVVTAIMAFTQSLPDDYRHFTDTVSLPHESNRYTERYPCGYCGKKDVYTRAYMNRKLNAATYLCYCCACDFVDKKDGWEAIETKLHFNGYH